MSVSGKAAGFFRLAAHLNSIGAANLFLNFTPRKSVVLYWAL